MQCKCTAFHLKIRAEAELAPSCGHMERVEILTA